jgi:DNA-binding Lrp family transcriptional regulator
MESVYVLVRVKPTFEQRVGEHIRKLKACQEIHPLFGEYDYIVKLQGKDHAEITKIILQEVRGLEGVAATKTMVKTSF